jgi:hypothetical protein
MHPTYNRKKKSQSAFLFFQCGRNGPQCGIQRATQYNYSTIFLWGDESIYMLTKSLYKYTTRVFMHILLELDLQ